MRDVFISYSSVNKPIADGICHYFEANGVRCWYAPRDIPPGRDYRVSIMDAIGKVRCFVLIYTKDSNASPDVLNEITAAAQARIPILPFRVENVPMNPAVAYYLNGVHWLDAISPPLKANIRTLCQSVCNILGIPFPGIDIDIEIDNPFTPPPPPEPWWKKLLKTLKSKWWLLLILIATLAGAWLLRPDPEPEPAAEVSQIQQFWLNDLSGIGNYRYPFFSDSMFSQDHGMYFMENTDTDTLSLIKTTTGDILRENIPLPSDAYLSTHALLSDSYDVIYFSENFINGEGRTPLVRIFDKKKNAWICREGIEIPLSETEKIHEGIYSGEVKVFRGDYPDSFHILIYDSQEGVECITRMVTVNPDATVSETDISGFSFTQFLAGIKKPGSSEHGVVLMLDSSMQIRVFDTVTCSIVDVSKWELQEEYLPYAVSQNRILSQDGRYLLARIYDLENEPYTKNISILDLKSRYVPYSDHSSSNYEVFLAGEDQAFGFMDSGAYFSLFSIDLISGTTTQLMDSVDFYGNDAFLNVPFFFNYAEEPDCFLFLSESTPKDGTTSTLKLTITTKNGEVLAQSYDITVPYANYYASAHMKDGMLFVWITVPSELLENGNIVTTPYFAEYNITSDGTIKFLI